MKFCKLFSGKRAVSKYNDFVSEYHVDIIDIKYTSLPQQPDEDQPTDNLLVIYESDVQVGDSYV